MFLSEYRSNLSTARWICFLCISGRVYDRYYFFTTVNGSIQDSTYSVVWFIGSLRVQPVESDIDLDNDSSLSKTNSTPSFDISDSFSLQHCQH